MRAPTFVLGLLAAVAASRLPHARPPHQHGSQPQHGNPHFPGCSQALEAISVAHQQSEARGFCSWYLPKETAVTVTTTTTVSTATTATTTTTIPAVIVSITSCANPDSVASKKKRNAAYPTPKPAAWSAYPTGPWASSACSCLSSAAPTSTVTVTSTSITTTVTTTNTVSSGTITLNAVETFGVYATGSDFGSLFLDLNDATDDNGNPTTFWAGVSSESTSYSTFTLLANGSLSVVDPGPLSTSADVGALAITNAAGVSSDPERVTFVAAFDAGEAVGATSISCSITPSSDGTCPLTCEAAGEAVAYLDTSGYVDIGSSADAAGSQGVLSPYAVGSATAVTTPVDVAEPAADAVNQLTSADV